MSDAGRQKAGQSTRPARWYHYAALSAVSAGLAIGAVVATISLPFPVALATVAGVVLVVRGLLWLILKRREE
jgi:uncharacterized protein (DUF2062 family)